jgi:uncharacterized protein YecT (DUF1311 family)
MRTALLLISLSAAKTPALAADAAPLTAIELSFGAAPAVVHAGIARGETARYTFDAREDDWVELTLGSVEDNAVALVYGPGWRIGGDGEVIRGDTEMKLGGDAGTSSWSGLPSSGGTHLLVIGSDRGGAEFDLTIARRTPAASDCVELSQGPMNVCYEVLARRAESARAAAYAAFARSLAPERRRALAAVEKAWRSFVQAQCAFEAADYEGGSLQPTVVSGCMLGHLTARTAELEELASGER